MALRPGSIVLPNSTVRALSPQGTLNRGYSIAQLSDGSVLRRQADAPGGTRLLLTLADGSVHSTVDADSGTV